MATTKPIPVPGRPVPRQKPYIWVTELAKALGADRPCLWAGWFKAHFQHFKVERDAENLQEWNREHGALMKAKRAELERAGWRCRVEDENDLKIRGESADVAGKPDLVATLDDQVLVIDGKTGRQRDSDVWQVRFYINGLQLTRPELGQKDVIGIVHYKKHADRRVEPPTLAELDQIDNTIRTFAARQAPERTPSEWQCGRCNIAAADCPQRWHEGQRREARTSRF